MPTLDSRQLDLLRPLDDPTRTKALEIVTAIVAAGYDQRIAVPVAINHARRWIERRRAA